MLSDFWEFNLAISQKNSNDQFCVIPVLLESKIFEKSNSSSVCDGRGQGVGFLISFCLFGERMILWAQTSFSSEFVFCHVPQFLCFSALFLTDFLSCPNHFFLYICHSSFHYTHPKSQIPVLKSQLERNSVLQ